MNAENTFIKVILADVKDGDNERYINAKGVARFMKWGTGTKLSMFSKDEIIIRSSPIEFIRQLEKCNGIQVIGEKGNA